MRNFYRGDIVWADLGQHPGSHILSGSHPCLIVRTDKSKGSAYTVIPESSKERKKSLPVHVPILPENVQRAVTVKTIFMVEQMTIVDKQMIIVKIYYTMKLTLSQEFVFDFFRIILINCIRLHFRTTHLSLNILLLYCGIRWTHLLNCKTIADNLLHARA